MSTSLALSTILPDEKKPKYWFLETIEDTSKNYPRVRLLPNQWVLEDETIGKYWSSCPDWNIKCDRDIRKVFPVGTTFVAEGIEIYKNCYNVPTGNIYPLVADGKGHTVASDDMKEHFNFFSQGKSNPVKPLFNFKDDATKVLAGGVVALIEKENKYAAPCAQGGFYVDPDLWKLLLRNTIKKINSLLIGPTGTGKTVLVQKLADCLGMELSIFDLGAMHDPIAGLLGVHRLEKGVSLFDYSRFSEVIQKPGIVLLDEISRPAASCNNILFPLLDDRRVLPLEIAGSCGARNIPVHPGCIFIGTANIGAEYSGTSKIDRGLIDRFFSNGNWLYDKGTGSKGISEPYRNQRRSGNDHCPYCRDHQKQGSNRGFIYLYFPPPYLDDCQDGSRWV